MRAVSGRVAGAQTVKPGPADGMTIGRAEELTAACVRWAMPSIIGREPVPLPEGVSLEELVVANRMVRDLNRTVETTLPDGTRTYTIQMVCDDRITAAMYALEKFDNDPVALLAALGFSAAKDR